MKPLRQSLALADTADLLSGQLIVEIRRLVRALKPCVPRLERSFLRELRKMAFTPEQRKALLKVTAGAASEMLGGAGRSRPFWSTSSTTGGDWPSSTWSAARS